MIRTIAKLGTALEEAMVDAYSDVAALCEEGSEAADRLRTLAAEELGHASVLRALLPGLPEEDDASRTMLTVVRRQAEVLEAVSAIRRSLSPENLIAAIDELVKIEASLPENLFVHLQQFLPPETRPAVRRLAEDDDRHEALLAEARADLVARAATAP